MIYNLGLYERLTGKGAYLGNWTWRARNWRRSTRAIGGYWLGSFELSEEDITWWEILDFYNNNLGCRLLETSYGISTWEGMLYEFRLVRNGREYRRTLDPRWWHNRVKAVYSYPDSEDTEQGNLAYDPGGNDAFQDDGQDFSEWETAAGDAVYQISVTNSDDTTAWGFLGAAFTTTNPDDSIYVYTDVEMTTAGWGGEASGKTPSSYVVRHVTLAGTRQDTSWSENTDSSGIYGRMDYILSLGGTTPEAAEMAQGRELAAAAWPRSRNTGGGGARVAKAGPGVLEVSVAGYWATLNWRYRESSRSAGASDLITTLAGESEFVSIGRVEDNDMLVKADCDPIPQRLGDLIENVVLQGDMDYNLWQGSVYADQELIYERAPTAVAFYKQSDGTLVDKARVPVIPSMMVPGVLILDEAAPVGGQPPGTSNVWDDPRVGYVEEVEFEAPGTLRYRISGEEESVTVLMEQLQGRLVHTEREY